MWFGALCPVLASPGAGQPSNALSPHDGVRMTCRQGGPELTCCTPPTCRVLGTYLIPGKTLRSERPSPTRNRCWAGDVMVWDRPGTQANLAGPVCTSLHISDFPDAHIWPQKALSQHALI